MKSKIYLQSWFKQFFNFDFFPSRHRIVWQNYFEILVPASQETFWPTCINLMIFRVKLVYKKFSRKGKKYVFQSPWQGCISTWSSQWNKKIDLTVNQKLKLLATEARWNLRIRRRKKTFRLTFEQEFLVQF